MKAGRTLLVWLALLVLLAAEFLLSQHRTLTLAVPAIGLAMAIIVAMSFMRLPSAPATAIVFALAAVFWLGIMMGLGSLDPVTRHDIPVSPRTL